MSVRIFLYLTLLTGFACTNNQKENKLNIAVSSNMQYSIKALIKVFEQDHNIKCNIITASSGKLSAQIMSGAPYQVFLSADMLYPNSLNDKKLTLDPPKIYGSGQLALWSKTIPSSKLLNELSLNKSIKIAIPNPKHAPYGKAAMYYLESLLQYDQIKERLVFAESVGQSNQFVYSGSAELGFTALSTLINQKELDGSYIIVNSANYPPIAQGIVTIKTENAELEEQAKSFYNFMQSQKAKNILNQFGFLTENEQATRTN